MIQIEQSKDLFLLKKEEARADAKLAKEATPINPDSKKIRAICEKVLGSDKHVEICTTEEAEILIFGMTHDILAYQCSQALRLSAWFSPEIFKKEHISVMISCLNDKNLYEEYAFGVGRLAFFRSELFQRKDVDILLLGLSQKGVEDHYAEVLAVLCQTIPDFFKKQDVDLLIVGLNNKNAS